MTYYLFQLIGAIHQSAALALFVDEIDRTTHIDVDEVDLHLLLQHLSRGRETSIKVQELKGSRMKGLSTTAMVHLRNSRHGVGKSTAQLNSKDILAWMALDESPL